MQPLWEVTLSRPWHWGIAIVSAPGASVPDSLGPSPVAASSSAVVIKVRHAQDIDAEIFEGDWEWATATLHLRSLTEFDDITERPEFDGRLVLPGGRLTIGDADGLVTVDQLDENTRVRIYVSEGSDSRAADIHIDLAPGS